MNGACFWHLSLFTFLSTEKIWKKKEKIPLKSIIVRCFIQENHNDDDDDADDDDDDGEKEVKRRMIRSWAVFSPEGTKSGVGPRGGWGQANLETQLEIHLRNTFQKYSRKYHLRDTEYGWGPWKAWGQASHAWNLNKLLIQTETKRYLRTLKIWKSVSPNCVYLANYIPTVESNIWINLQSRSLEDKCIYWIVNCPFQGLAQTVEVYIGVRRKGVILSPDPTSSLHHHLSHSA